ncbi:hypothetical protein MPSEU_000529000 [Mayamaea pseudoterrestris]|nr:hypothetical protein MPSEU_000529000 [Mayamaea pseudoterrestris]
MMATNSTKSNNRGRGSAPGMSMDGDYLLDGGEAHRPLARRAIAPSAKLQARKENSFIPMSTHVKTSGSEKVSDQESRQIVVVDGDSITTMNNKGSCLAIAERSDEESFYSCDEGSFEESPPPKPAIETLKASCAYGRSVTFKRLHKASATDSPKKRNLDLYDSDSEEELGSRIPITSAYAKKRASMQHKNTITSDSEDDSDQHKRACTGSTTNGYQRFGHMILEQDMSVCSEEESIDYGASASTAVEDDTPPSKNAKRAFKSKFADSATFDIEQDDGHSFKQVNARRSAGVNSNNGASTAVEDDTPPSKTAKRSFKSKFADSATFNIEQDDGRSFKQVNVCRLAEKNSNIVASTAVEDDTPPRTQRTCNSTDERGMDQEKRWPCVQRKIHNNGDAAGLAGSDEDESLPLKQREIVAHDDIAGLTDSDKEFEKCPSWVRRKDSFDKAAGSVAVNNEYAKMSCRVVKCMYPNLAAEKASGTIARKHNNYCGKRKTKWILDVTTLEGPKKYLATMMKHVKAMPENEVHMVLQTMNLTEDDPCLNINSYDATGKEFRKILGEDELKLISTLKSGATKPKSRVYAAFTKAIHLNQFKYDQTHTALYDVVHCFNKGTQPVLPLSAKSLILLCSFFKKYFTDRAYETGSVYNAQQMRQIMGVLFYTNTQIMCDILKSSPFTADIKESTKKAASSYRKRSSVCTAQDMQRGDMSAMRHVQNRATSASTRLNSYQATYPAADE